MQWLVSAIVTGLLNWLAPIIARLVKEKKDSDEAKAEATEQAQVIVKKVKDAKTESEIEDAAKTIARDSF